ncbi:hypothetical protein ANO11243_089640 [Dothideomycetidae sp. 11243]|nr:hypothetical protein ANO11243_089640 [fungal sp. No.11243]
MRSALAVLACLPSAFARLGERFSPLDIQQKNALRSLKRDTDPSLLYPTYNLSVPVDHFPYDCMYEPHSDDSFPLRYWFDASNYQEGGPVIVLLGGEDDGPDRLPYLQKGILAQLSKATNGIGVVLEHRYYGESIPTPDFSVSSLRFLTTQQAMADVAYFAQNIQFPGLEQYDLTSEQTAYITYGGSYAGAFSAFLRVLYPETIWGAISSSGVPEAIVDYWQYNAAIAEYGPPACINTQQTLIQAIDGILIGQKNTTLVTELKDIFGLGNLTYDDDFANTVSEEMGLWQALNWDPAVNYNGFYQYCDIITNNSVVYPGTNILHDQAESLIKASGVQSDDPIVTSMLNLIGYINETAVSQCTQSQDACFSMRNPALLKLDDASQSWRLWTYQYCTQWGFLSSGSGVPADQRPLLSRLITVEFLSIICEEAFNITVPPDTDSINQYGGNRLYYDRLAFIDGEVDPWRGAGVHGFAEGAPHRISTTNMPFHLIPGGVHHWDENGVFPNQTTSSLPPTQVKQIQQEEARFVVAWVKEFQEFRRK